MKTVAIMRIKKSVYDEIINNCPSAPPEIGGIIGGRNNLVDCICFDVMPHCHSSCTYRPNTDFLNQQIRLWAVHVIEFMGLFHTHPIGEHKLSNKDKNYIFDIMLAMPKRVSKLYFPAIKIASGGGR